MKTVTADLTAYCSYNCLHCGENDDVFFEASEFTDVDIENMDILIECPFCGEKFKITKLD